MIKYRVRVHDKFSVEFKMWYQNTLPKLNKFRLESWIFLPAALDINALTYTRAQFYSDIKSYFRNITPVFRLDQLGEISDLESFDIIPSPSAPMDYLLNSVVNLVNYPTKQNIAEFEYQIKTFCAIFKSAVREEYNKLKRWERQGKQQDVTSFALSFLERLCLVLENYAHLSSYLKHNSEEKYYNLYAFGEEFIINLAELYAFKVYNHLKRDSRVGVILSRISRQRSDRGYSSFSLKDRMGNAMLLHRLNLLKKYVESDLFLSVAKRKSGVFKEQVWYSIAAGLSMIFATAIAFTFQQKYGNFTMPLFVALVISYMLKDRIKELVRAVFSSNRKLKYFDNKTYLRVKESLIGLSREGVDFVPQTKVPEEIMALRCRSALVDVENRISEESILFYRNLLYVDNERLSQTSEYEIEGLNHILLLNLSSVIKKMDNPQQRYFKYKGNSGTAEGGQDDALATLLVDKVYYINMIFQFTSSSGDVTRLRYRVMMSRAGILNMEEIKTGCTTN